MAHHATQQADCANCHYAFTPGAPREFCPQCGQQNHAVEISFGHVVEEFLEGIFHFDGKVFRTAGLLLFRPGELTRRFLAGQRVPYVPPIRLYVFISFVFFLLLGTVFSHEEEGGPEPKKTAKASGLRALGPGLSADAAALARYRQQRRTGPAALADSITAVALDSAAQETALALKGTPAGKKQGSNSMLEVIRHLPAHPTEAQADSVLRSHGEAPSFFGRLAVRRAVRWRDSTREEAVHQVLRAGSILLFLLMPLAALLLKGAYFRQHRYYLSHLVFTIHVQCFLFIFIGLLIGLDKLHAPDWLTNLLNLVPIVYFVVALHTFYQQSWSKTVAKSLLLGVAYGCTLLLVVLAVGLAGAALF